MKGVVFLGDRRLEVRDLPDPEPGPGEVVVAMKASGLCGSDLKDYRARSDRGSRGQVVRGHEPSGEIAGVGPAVEGLRAGDRVMVHHYSGCAKCRMCRDGYTQMCLVRHETYGTSKDGGHADYMLAPASACVALPEGLSYEEGAACACGTGTAYHAVLRLELSAGDTLAVFGLGPVGLSAVMFAVSLGARVFAVDVVSERRALASRFGADEVIDANTVDPVAAVLESTDGRGADASLDATGIPQARADAVDCVRPWGRVCLVGEGGDTTFDVSRQIIHKQLTITGSPGRSGCRHGPCPCGTNTAGGTRMVGQARRGFGTTTTRTSCCGVCRQPWRANPCQAPAGLADWVNEAGRE